MRGAHREREREREKEYYGLVIMCQYLGAGSVFDVNRLAPEDRDAASGLDERGCTVGNRKVADLLGFDVVGDLSIIVNATHVKTGTSQRG